MNCKKRLQTLSMQSTIVVVAMSLAITVYFAIRPQWKRLEPKVSITRFVGAGDANGTCCQESSRPGCACESETGECWVYKDPVTGEWKRAPAMEGPACVKTTTWKTLPCSSARCEESDPADNCPDPKVEVRAVNACKWTGLVRICNEDVLPACRLVVRPIEKWPFSCEFEVRRYDSVDPAPFTMDAYICNDLGAGLTLCENQPTNKCN